MRKKITLKVVIIKNNVHPPPLHPNLNLFNSFEPPYAEERVRENYLIEIKYLSAVTWTWRENRVEQPGWLSHITGQLTTN